MRRLRNAALTAALLIAGCRTATPEIAPLTAVGPPEAWQQLVALRGGTIESHARMRVVDGDRRRSFSATLAAGENRFSLTAFTPVGTAAFTIYGEGEKVVFADHIHYAYWKGDFADLARRLRLPSTELGAADLGWLLMGVPAGGDSSPCTSGDSGCIAGPGMEYRVGAAGLEGVTLDGGVTIGYDPPSFPPARVVMSGGDGRSLELEHNETRHAPKPPQPPDLTRYRCCLDPSLPK